MSQDFEVTLHKIAFSITPLSIATGGVIGMLTSFLIPLQGFILITFALVLGDLVTGMIAANGRGEKIRSKGIGRTIYKFIVYMIAILCSSGIEKVFGGGVGFITEMQPITWLVAATIALREIKSVFENIESYTGTPLTSRIGLFEKLFNSKSDKDDS